MSFRITLFLTILGLATSPLAQTADPLVHEGTIDAPIEDVWRAWTTSEGLMSWLAPHAQIDFRIGGKMRANYNADGNLDDPQTIENTILAYDPHRMLSIRVSQAPSDFPFPNAVKEMWTVVYFDPQGPGRTHVSVVSMGFTAETESQAMRAFFDQGNATTIRQMQERLGRQANP